MSTESALRDSVPLRPGGYGDRSSTERSVLQRNSPVISKRVDANRWAPSSVDHGDDFGGISASRTYMGSAWPSLPNASLGLRFADESRSP